MPEPDRLLTPSEVANLFGVEIGAVQNWVHKGWITPDSVTPGRARRYRESKIRKLHQDLLRSQQLQQPQGDRNGNAANL